MPLRQFALTTAEHQKRMGVWKQEHIDQGKGCQKCGRNHNLSLEHIIPVAILKDMGIDERDLIKPEDNWMVLCRVCNNQKGSHLDFNNPKTKPLLLHFLSLVKDLPL